jgi:16S rRNA G966 N2-methylase RsmD
MGENVRQTLIPPIYDPTENYEKVYTDLDYKGKVILEVGADIGSTASFFLSKGAKHVISVEGKKEYFDRLVKNIETYRMNVTPVFLTLKNAEELQVLIEQYKPDILHMDCEGGEFVIPGISDDVLKTLKEVQLEIHCYEDKKDAIVNKFLKNNFKLIKDLVYHTNVNFSIVGLGIGSAWIDVFKREDECQG